MSVEEIQRFVADAEESDVLKAELSGLGEASLDPEELVRLAEKNGYHFTTDQLRGYVSSLSTTLEGDELREEDLDRAAGGILGSLKTDPGKINPPHY